MLNRLTSVNYGDGQTQSYGFDSLGNRTSKSDSATGSETYTFDAANRLTNRNVGGTNSVYTNDANGNTLTGGNRTNTWDSQNRLVSCVKSGSPNVTSSFVYGADGIRRQETTNAGGTTTTTDFVTDNSLFMLTPILLSKSRASLLLFSPTLTQIVKRAILATAAL